MCMYGGADANDFECACVHVFAVHFDVVVRCFKFVRALFVVFFSLCFSFFL